jgi:hypothetical protein
MARASDGTDDLGEDHIQLGQVTLFLTVFALVLVLEGPWGLIFLMGGRGFIYGVVLGIIVQVAFFVIGLLRNRGRRDAYRTGLLQVGVVLLIPPAGGVVMATLPLMQNIWWTIGTTAALVGLWFVLDLLNRARDLS